MKRQPGFISTQLHRAIGESSTYLNYAVWESTADFRAAFSHPEFSSGQNCRPIRPRPSLPHTCSRKSRCPAYGSHSSPPERSEGRSVMALKSTSDHYGSRRIDPLVKHRSDSNPHRLGLRSCQRRGPCSESDNSAGPRADRSRGAGIDDPSDRLVVGLRSETYSGCRIATLAGTYRPGGARPFLHHHPGNERAA
jgi:hypothetical protein